MLRKVWPFSFFERRRRRRIAREFNLLLQMLDNSPEVRKHVRRILRVKGYES